MSDYELTLKIRNAPLLNLMRQNGYTDVAKLARASGIGKGGIHALLSLRSSVYGGSDNNTPTQTARKLSEFFHVHPEELAPSSHIRTPLKQNKFVAQVSENQLKELSQSTRDPSKILEWFETESRDAFEDMLSAGDLNERQKNILRHRFRDNLTLDKTAKKVGVTRERIRQIEHKALRILLRTGKQKLIDAAGVYAESVGIKDY